MKLYTRAGDTGKTQIIGNQVVSKSDARVEAYGMIDELNSLIGMIASQMTDIEMRKEIQLIQQYLFDCGTDVAAPAGFDYRTNDEYIQWLEDRIDYYAQLPDPITQFILPGGHELASLVHYARALTRTTERRVVYFMDINPSNENVLKFLNRLSDYFFALARVINYQHNVKETVYERSGDVFR